MRSSLSHTRFLSVMLLYPLTALADGGFFYLAGESTQLAQTQQQVLIAFHRDAADTADQATYVLRTRYSGEPGELAWVVPVPATPTDVLSHEDDALFEALKDATEPQFFVMTRTPRRIGCFCGGLLDAGGMPNHLVTVEASGQAGIYDWSALTSTGGNALVTWLNDNGFSLPTEAETILDDYIQQDMHFLAIRISEPQQVQVGEEGEIEIPPIQFTCQTSMRFYPMAISRISAASQTEVLLYVLAEHRAEAANVANGLIDPFDLVYDATSPSLTNYESLFTATVAELDGTGLITEYASTWYAPSWFTSAWPDAPAGVLDLTFVTRLRTVLNREDMTFDLTLQDAASDKSVYSDFTVSPPSGTAAASLAGQGLVAVMFLGLMRTATARLRRRRS